MRQTGKTYTETDWEVYEHGLTETLLWVKERYGNPPLYVTENGSAFYDPPVANDGRVAGSAARRLSAAPPARRPRSDRARAPTCAATWPGRCSTISNGRSAISKRFGIVHVNFETQERTPKDSGRYYAGSSRPTARCSASSGWAPRRAGTACLKQIVTTDIGGTHARFAIATIDRGRVVELGPAVTLRTGEHASFETAWEEFGERMGCELPRELAIAVAGPVDGEVLKLTNNPWVISPGAGAAAGRPAADHRQRFRRGRPCGRASWAPSDFDHLSGPTRRCRRPGSRP